MCGSAPAGQAAQPSMGPDYGIDSANTINSMSGDPGVSNAPLATTAQPVTQGNPYSWQQDNFSNGLGGEQSVAQNDQNFEQWNFLHPGQANWAGSPFANYSPQTMSALGPIFEIGAGLNPLTVPNQSMSQQAQPSTVAGNSDFGVNSPGTINGMMAGQQPLQALSSASTFQSPAGQALSPFGAGIMNILGGQAGWTT